MTGMPSLFAMGDKLAHVLRVRVKAGGEPVDLTDGRSPPAWFGRIRRR